MTDTTNGWPGKPGVPLNPERDGWHWMETEHGLAPWRWKENPESIMWEFGWEVGDGVISSAYFAALGPCTYHNPCITPDQATALQARVAELEGVLLEARDDLTEWIDGAHQHREKYPHIMQDFKNDMEIVRRIDAVLEGKKNV